jgi:hypothetical protein
MNREEVLEQLVRELVNVIRVLLTENLSDEETYIGNDNDRDGERVPGRVGPRPQLLEDMP